MVEVVVVAAAGGETAYAKVMRQERTRPYGELDAGWI